MESHRCSPTVGAGATGGDQLLTRLEACALFGVELRTWTEWERVGRVPPGRLGVTARGRRCRIYSLAAMTAIKSAWDRAGEPSIDPERPSLARVPVASARHPGMVALVDASDLPLIAGRRWNWSPGKRDGDGSVIVAMTGTPKPSLARILLGITDAAHLVSHRNGDRLDCRRENLVVRTRGQVRRAARKAARRGGVACSSRFKGVTLTEGGRKWSATIRIEGAYRNLGRFRSEVDAALAYEAASREAFGDEAALNLPDAAEAARLRALEQILEQDATWPPAGMVDRAEACTMFGVSFSAWMAWERKGRITCGEYHRLPNYRPGRCKLYPRDALERARAELERLGKPYADPDRAGVWRVPLKSHLTHREALIDAADLPIVEGRSWNWSARTDGLVAGNVVLASTTGQTPLARLIMAAVGTDARVRYSNGDPLDCRRVNLAVLTLAEQVRGNRKMGSASGRKYTSAYKGVSWDEARGKWLAQVRKDGAGRQLGRFDDEADAAMAYDAAVRVLFGELGHVNFSDRPSTERAMADARQAMEDVVDARRVARRRQRDLERSLRSASGTDDVVDDERVATETARQWFDVSAAVWLRWRRFGWVPAGTRIGGESTVSLAAVERLLARCGLNVLPHPDPARAGVWRLPLCGETARGREALIDADAVPLIRARRWRFAAATSGRGGEVQTMDPGENVRLHYVVLGIGSDPHALHVGHRNGDPLDCRRENLVQRTLTDTRASAQKQATFRGRPCTSRFKGVWYEARRERWVATIKKDRVQRRLGSFRDELAAAEAYDAAARELFGEHARLNFPEGTDAWLDRESASERVAA